MFKNPLAALFAIVVVGVSIEVVERQSRQAAYALLLLILLGIITFNAARFTQQTNLIIGALAAPSTGHAGGRGNRANGTQRSTLPRVEPGVGH